MAAVWRCLFWVAVSMADLLRRFDLLKLFFLRLSSAKIYRRYGLFGSFDFESDLAPNSKRFPVLHDTLFESFGSCNSSKSCPISPGFFNFSAHLLFCCGVLMWVRILVRCFSL